jgi:DNA-damage-inducible protein J
MANIQVRVSDEEKKAAKEILDALGLSLSGAIRIFLRQVVDENGIPFELKMKKTDKKEEKVNPFERRKIC